MRGQYSQRLQTRDTEPRCQETGQEWQHGGPCLANARDVAHTSSEQPAREDLRAVVDEDGVHRSEE